MDARDESRIGVPFTTHYLWNNKPISTVINTVDIANADVPWFLRPLIWFVTRLGAQPPPSPLKALCESEPG